MSDDRLNKIEDRLYRIEAMLDKFIEDDFNESRISQASGISDVYEAVRCLEDRVDRRLGRWEKQQGLPPIDCESCVCEPF